MISTAFKKQSLKAFVKLKFKRKLRWAGRLIPNLCNAVLKAMLGSQFGDEHGEKFVWDYTYRYPIDKQIYFILM